MSGYILCQIKRASLPFYIENISTNIYSIEELCYYLYHNIYLLDETIINEHLCDWIKNELGLLKLYQKLYRILEEERGAGDFILAVFREINYLTHEQFKKLNEELVVLEQLPEVARKKKKGDYLVDNRMYVNAIRIYEDALRSVDTGGLGGQYEGEIFHNMGCAYLHLFQIEEAKECFEKAYEKLHTKLILKDADGGSPVAGRMCQNGCGSGYLQRDPERDGSQKAGCFPGKTGRHGGSFGKIHKRISQKYRILGLCFENRCYIIPCVS